MARKKREYLPSIAWHVGAHLSGVLVLAMSYVQQARIVMALRWSLFAFFLFASLDVVVSRYHLWAFQPVAPQPKRFALITGATAGLGREIAYMLAEKKYSLVLVGRTEPILERMRAEIELVNKPVEVEYCVCDLSSAAGVLALLEFLKEKNFVIDILVNAATDVEVANFHEIASDEIEGMLQVNVNAMVRVTHAVVQGMAKRGVGRVLNISTLGAVASTPTAAVFGASKAFVASFSQAINYELRSTGVTVTCYIPGTMEVNVNDPHANRKGLTTAEYYPWVVYPTDSAAFAVDALLNANDVAYDAYLNQFWAFLLRAFVPTRVGQALIAVCWHAPSKAWQQVKRETRPTAAPPAPAATVATAAPTPAASSS